MGEGLADLTIKLDNNDNDDNVELTLRRQKGENAQRLSWSFEVLPAQAVTQRRKR